jgi:RimJ/RimL family protein N-acetyltransferase
MATTVSLRPYLSGEEEHAHLPDSEFDDFGPRGGHSVPVPCSVDADGHLAVVADGRVVGDVGWHWVHWGPNSASRCPMLGISLAPEHRGKGIGTEAQRQAVDLLFRATNVNRIEAHTDVENVAEQRALTKAGFTSEGVIRGGQWRDGAYRDGYLFSILREEWRAAAADAPRP